jgi:putative FmdB family regulatory protein
MPEYTYRCSACEIVYERRHSIKEILTDCEECQTANTLIRIPSIPMVLKKSSDHGKISNPGKIVKDFISDAKEELKKEKEDFTKKEY